MDDFHIGDHVDFEILTIDDPRSFVLDIDETTSLIVLTLLSYDGKIFDVATWKSDEDGTTTGMVVLP